MAVAFYYHKLSSDVNIDEQALSDLINTLIRLKKAGGKLKRDEIWVKPSSSFIDTAKDLHASIFHLQALKRVKSGLDTLAKSLEAIIITRQEELLPVSRHLGLSSLPIDVVMYIFRHLLDSYKDPFEGARIAIRDLSKVNRQFRNILVESTDAWAYLDLSRCSGEVLERHLHRSKQAPLSVRFKYNSKMQQDIDLAMAHKHRWKHLNATFNSNYGDDEAHGKLMSNFPSVDFPSIRSLCLNADDDLHEREKLDIFSKWTFPNAEVVEMLRDLPNPASFNCDAIKSFKFYGTHYDYDEEAKFLIRLTDFFRPAVNLQTVYLDVSQFLPTGRDEHKSFDEVELPSVTEFTVTTCFSGCVEDFGRPFDLNSLAEIIRALRMPNVKNISISIASFEDEFELWKWVPLAFPKTHDMGSVSRLSFNVKWYIKDGKSRNRPPIYYGCLLRRFPSIKAFSIDAGECNVDFGDQVDLHDLQTLQIDNYDDGPWTYPGDRDVSDIWQHLRDIAEAGAALNELKIDSKVPLDIKELEEIFPDTYIQVTFSPRRDSLIY